MAIDFLKLLGIAAVLMLIQVAVLNNIHLFGCATPLLFVYIILLAPCNYPRWTVMLLAFIIGLISDSFTNTPGVASASLTFIGFVQPVYLKLFLSRESPEDLRPSLATLGFSKFFSYSFFLIFLFVALFFTLEEFAFFHWKQWLNLVVGSTLITFFLIFTIEAVRKS